MIRRIFCIFTLAWSPDGAQLVVGGNGITVRLLDAATLATRLVYRGHSAYISSLTWSPDGRYIASASGDQTIQVWRSDDGAAVTVWPYRGPYRLVWSPQGDLVAASSFTGTVDLWRTSDWSRVRTIPCSASSLAWSPDGRRLAAGHTGGVRLLPITAAGAERQLVSPALRYVWALDWAPNGERLATAGGRPEAVEVWDVTQAVRADVPTVTFRGGGSYSWSVDWAPDGSRIASSALGQVHLWEPETGVLLATYLGHTGCVHSLAWSPDGSRIASGGQDVTVQVWRPDDAVSPAQAVKAQHEKRI